MHTHKYGHILGTAVATFAIVITAGCGAEVASTPSEIGDPVGQQSQPPSPQGGEPLVDLPQRGKGAEGWR